MRSGAATTGSTGSTWSGSTDRAPGQLRPYIVSAQAVYDHSYDLYLANCAAPVDPTVFSVRLPPGLAHALAKNETCRVEVTLLAGEPVKAALENFDASLRAFWREAGSGTAAEGSQVWGTETAAYHHLIACMRADIFPAGGG